MDKCWGIWIVFTQLGTFECATQQFIKKAKNASAAVISLISKMQIDSFETYKIFELLAKSIMIYAWPVYALQILEALKRVQIQFYKRILGLHQLTPGYAVWLETGISHVALTVFKNTVNWIIKILLMNEKRFRKYPC